MNTKELESCLHIIGYWLNEDKTVIEKILNSETRIVKHFIEPFSKELNANLLNKGTIKAKRDLIKFYVFEFWELQGFYKEYDEILFTGSLCNYSPVFYEHTNENGTVRKLNEFENYVVNSWNLFDMLFNEIQVCCIKYKIDFFKVCNELNFSPEYFDSGISMAFEEMQKENLPPQQTETKTDKLKAELGKYGFFELSKVKQLSEPNKQSLIELISTNDLPYSIAMFEYLVFLKHLKAEHFTTDYKLFKAVAKWFKVAERAVKGNIYVLNEHSKENRTRYTADQQKQTVQKDYEKLK